MEIVMVTGTVDVEVATGTVIDVCEKVGIATTARVAA